VEEAVTSYKQQLEEELKAADSYKPPVRMLYTKVEIIYLLLKENVMKFFQRIIIFSNSPFNN